MKPLAIFAIFPASSLNQISFFPIVHVVVFLMALVKALRTVWTAK